MLPMPSLSHAMVSGKVKRWLKQEGEQCAMYDLLLEVETETLVEEAYRLDDFAGRWWSQLLVVLVVVHACHLLQAGGLYCFAGWLCMLVSCCLQLLSLEQHSINHK